MSKFYVSPASGKPLKKKGNWYISENNSERFPIINSIPRFCDKSNYSESFGYQWNKFDITQLDSKNNTNFTKNRFYISTNWDPELISKENVLEVGSGAGRFTEVFLKTTNGILHSVDYSNAVDANFKNNIEFRERLELSQASIYEMPFPDNTFDKIFCFGVLQHTPSFENSIESLVKKAKFGGEIVVDFYPIKGWHTKIHSKYILRPLTKKITHKSLYNLICANINWMINLFDFLCLINLKIITRFIPISDLSEFPKNLTFSQRKKWAILDTFDMFSPEFDNPMRIDKVKNLFIKFGCKVTFAGFLKNNPNSPGAVVRAIRYY